MTMQTLIYFQKPDLEKSYVKAHTRKLKDGRRVEIAAYYDKRARKGSELAPAHGHNLAHLVPEEREKFDAMHKEHHLLTFYQGHALKKRIGQHERAVQTLKERAVDFERQGAHKAATKLHNKMLRHESDLIRHKRALGKVETATDWLANEKEKRVLGSGALDMENAEKHHAAYVEKLGSPWKPMAETIKESAPNKFKNGQWQSENIKLPPGEYGGKNAYIVKKVGRKWLEVVREGGTYPVKMEINDVNRNAKQGERLEVNVNVQKESNKYGTTFTIYPLTIDQARRSRNIKNEIDKSRLILENKPKAVQWLKWVEEKADDGWLYDKGIEKLKELGIENYPELSARLQRAKEKVIEFKKEREEYKAKLEKNIAEQGQTYLDVPYDDKDYAKKYGAKWNPAVKKWYVVGKEIPDKLQKYAIKQSTHTSRQMPTSGYIDENDPSIWGHELLGWEGRKWSAFHAAQRTGYDPQISDYGFPEDY